MAIAIDNTSFVAGDASRSTITWSHTVGGTERLLLVGVGMTATPVDSSPTVTFNTVGLTAVAPYQRFLSDFEAIQMFWLINPDTGAHDIVLTGAAGYTSIAGCAISFTGVDQSTPLGTPNGTSVSGTNVTIAVTSATDELVVDVAGTGGASSETLTADASQDQKFDFTFSYTGDADQLHRRMGMSTKPGAASVTMLWSTPATDGAGIVAVPVKPAAASSVMWLRHRA